MPRYSEQQVMGWVTEYKETGSLRAVERAFGIPHNTIGKRIKKYINVPAPIRHSFDSNFFSKDSPGAFYWAGFIAADGCIAKSHGVYKSLEIGLGIKDSVHLEKFKNAIKFSGSIKNIKWGDLLGVRIRINSQKICDDLSRFGIIPNKTFVYKLPKWLENHHMINHFIRGYFDGDGCFYTQLACNRKIPQLKFELIGTESFVLSCKRVFNNYCRDVFGNHNIKKKNKIFVLIFGGTLGTKVLRDFMYKDSTNETRLGRKHKIAYKF